ncbi:hypothetical protein ACFL1K_01595 [Candidatus Omnitrophota bacterium]
MTGYDHHETIMSQEQAQKIEEIYDGLFTKVKELSGIAGEGPAFDFASSLVDFIIDTLSKKDNPLLLYTSKVFEKDYIFAHSLNVTIISIKIGLKLDFENKRLKSLGLKALSHAKGDAKFRIKLSGGKELDQEIERVVGLADIYDSMTHPPSYRIEMTAYDAISSMINTDPSFDRDLLKILLDEVSLYPEGSWVQLSSKEIGRVAQINKDSMLRPKVKVIMDRDGEYLKEAKEVDLVTNGNKVIYITRSLTSGEIGKIGKRRRERL